MAKLSHFGLLALLTAVSAVAAPTGSKPIPLAVSQPPQIRSTPSFRDLVARSMKDAGVAHSFVSATDPSRVRTERLVPIQKEEWDGVKADAAKHVARLVENLENNLGHIVIHEIEVKTLSLLADPEKGIEQDFQVVLLKWSPLHRF